MSGILFFQTADMASVQKFYTEKVGAQIWLKQKGCIILKHGNLLFGFCQQDTSEPANVILTFFYPDKQSVNTQYQILKNRAESPPQESEQYRIYHFFATDPEGRAIEFQCFLHHLNPYKDGVEALQSRRSIRHFVDTPVPDSVLWNIFEVCRYSPTSRNSQSYYYVVIKDIHALEKLGSIRGPSEPIKKAPMAVAVCADPDKSGAYVQDGCIAAYHFMVAAYCYGLGTCWIASMDTSEVKNIVGIPESHYVATVTPVGYPEEIPEPPSRRVKEEMVTGLQ
ncbi:MAG: nitroreductase family protein [Candidatus Methanofastidiosia archaeon]|jgi:nitroreductase